jgi:hypothetical protein
MILDMVGSVALWAILTFVCVSLIMMPDRVFAMVTRPLHRRLFPLACTIARSLRDDRGAWAYNPSCKTFAHGPSGIVVYSGLGGSGTIRVKTEAGFWEPGLVERRIIADATNKLARAEVERAAETHMHAADGGATDRPLLTHEPGVKLDVDRRGRSYPGGDGRGRHG